MKILILGGTGSMGAPLTELLAERGENVYVTSRANRKSLKNIRYIQGNAHDDKFMETLLSDNYDAIIDFMIYTTSEFKDRVLDLLKSTKQYIFLSSSRVYANSVSPITEESSRLLDVIDDREYLMTDEYALAKARQEDILQGSGYTNWTIVRPYITYNNERLQLGVYEKENWLYRALHGKTIVFSKDIAERYTTMTHGYDVARGIARLVGNDKALGEKVHITVPKSIKWKEVLKIYLDVIEAEMGKRPEVLMLDNADGIKAVLRNQYQVDYDRLYDRHFDNTKVKALCGEDMIYKEIENGLEECLKTFIREKRKFRRISWGSQAYFDKVAGERESLEEIISMKAKIKYIVARYTPYIRLRYGGK